MLSNKPYLLRAFYQWIGDSACTPILVIDATHQRCRVPKEYIEDGEIVFNISKTAVRDMKITNEAVEFKASFSSIIHIIYIPMSAVLSIYAEENNEGIFFDPEEDDSDSATSAGVKLESISSKSFPVDGIDTNIIPQATQKAKPVLKLVE